MSPRTLTREEAVSLCLRQCALVIDPRNGFLKSLAEDLDLHETTLSVWITNGRIPRKAARRLRARFGKLVDIDVVSADT